MSAGQTTRRRGARRLRRAGIVAAGLGLALILYLVVAGAWAYRVTPTVLRHAQASPVPRLTDLPPGAVAILLAVEDPSFYRHPGVDPTFAPGQGTVTLTRSLVHTLYLDGPTMPGVAGGLQRVYRFADRTVGLVDLGPDAMAIVLNRRVPKDRQIELFVAHVYMGAHGDEQLIGLERAAHRYHRKQLKELTREEFVGLVAMIIGPNSYHPIRHRDRWAERVRRIKRLLREECRPQGVLDVYYGACGTGVNTAETATRPSAGRARSTASATVQARPPLVAAWTATLVPLRGAREAGRAAGAPLAHLVGGLEMGDDAPRFRGRHHLRPTTSRSIARFSA